MIRTGAYLILFIFLYGTAAIAGGTNGGKAPVINSIDVKTVIYEHIIEDFIDAMLPVTGNGKLLNLIPYSWKLFDSHIIIDENGARVSADVQVTLAGYTYTTQGRGRINARYDEAQDVILIFAEELFIDLELSFFGMDFEIYQINIADHFDLQIPIPAPRPFYPFYTFTLPTGKEIKIFSKADKYTIWFEPEQVVVGIKFIFRDEPPPGFVPPPPQPPCPPTGSVGGS